MNYTNLLKTGRQLLENCLRENRNSVLNKFEMTTNLGKCLWLTRRPNITKRLFVSFTSTRYVIVAFSRSDGW